MVGPGFGTADGVAKRLPRRERGGDVGPTHRLPLHRVAVQQSRLSRSSQHGRELPGEVVGVLDRRADPGRTHRSHPVRGVADQEDRSLRVAGRPLCTWRPLSVGEHLDGKIRYADRRPDQSLGRSVGELRIHRAQSPAAVAAGGEHHPTDRLDDVHPPGHGSGPGGQIGPEADAALPPEVRNPVEGDPESLADRTPDTVGSDQITGLDLGGRPSVRVDDRRRNPGSGGLEVGQ